MRKCELDVLCSRCGKRDRCPASVRRDKRARRPMSGSASDSLVAVAAEAMGDGWVSVRELSERMYGSYPSDKKSRMGRMVRARRPLARLAGMGLLVTRAVDGVAEYMLLPEWKEVLCPNRGR